MNGLPSWFKQEVPDATVLEIAQRLAAAKVHTVCQEARCPNLSYCFKHLKFTFIILGDTCTRNCRFCAVSKVDAQEKLTLDRDEPRRIAKIVKELGLNYVVITSVTRDDLRDGGAEIFAQTIALIHEMNSGVKIEVLIPDFKASVSSLELVLDARPDVAGHNIETTQRLYKALRPEADYEVSLDVLRKIKEIQPFITTKSSLMLGLGETEGEVAKTMQDLLHSGCDILALGQYLAPSPSHYPVKEFIKREQFAAYRQLALGLGFKSVSSGPLVRSSYQAEETYRELAYCV